MKRNNAENKIEFKNRETDCLIVLEIETIW